MYRNIFSIEETTTNRVFLYLYAIATTPLAFKNKLAGIIFFAAAYMMY